MEPPEPTCPRCGEYINENDQKYCPCGAELDFDNSYNDNTLICMACGRLVDKHEIEWKCHKCGYDGKPKNCAGCGQALHPKRDCLCEKCELEEQRAAYDDDEYQEAKLKYRLGGIM